MNLGWKLAATIQDWAPEDLLDTYTAERHPIGAWALEWTRAQVAIMRPDPHARAIASVIRDLMQTREGTSYFVGKMSGMLMRYNLPGDHPLIGCSVPDFEFEDGTRLGDLLHEGKGLLLDFAKKKTLCPRSRMERSIEVCCSQGERQQRGDRDAGPDGRLCRVGH
jgi:hypothetical protein